METQSGASQTAMLVASLRAMSCYEKDPLVRGADSLAALFLPKEKRDALQSAEIRSRIRSAVPEGLYEYVLARTAWFDALLKRALETGTQQIVLLGAGFDSRAIRFRDRLNTAILYELDTAATQHAKQAILSENQITVPSNVRFVAVDFENPSWIERLKDAGWNSSQQTLFLWEGVTFYLTPLAVASTLKLLGQNACAGSELSFDYQHAQKEQDLIRTGLEREEILFGLDESSCKEYVLGFGFHLTEHLNAEDLERRFLKGTDGKSIGTIKPIMRIVLARK